MKPPRKADTPSVTACLRLRIAPVFPVAELRSLVKEFFYPIGMDDRTDGRPLPPEYFPQTHIILYPQLNWIHIQFLCQHVHGRFHPESHLGRAVSLHRTGGGFIGIDRHPLILHVGQPVKRVPPPGENTQKG